MLLLMVGGVALAISRYDDPLQRTCWRGISVIMLLMSLDEVACLHSSHSKDVSEAVGKADGRLINA